MYGDNLMQSAGNVPLELMKCERSGGWLRIEKKELGQSVSPNERQTVVEETKKASSTFPTST